MLCFLTTDAALEDEFAARADCTPILRETGKLARLKLLWDDKFMVSLNMWEFCILYCVRCGIRWEDTGLKYDDHFIGLFNFLVGFVPVSTREPISTVSPRKVLHTLFDNIPIYCGRCADVRTTSAVTMELAIGRCSKCQLTAFCCQSHLEDAWFIHKPFCIEMRHIRPGRHYDLAHVTCNCCGMRSKRMSKCGRCLKVAYCSKEHQIKDWKKHKAACEL